MSTTTTRTQLLGRLLSLPLKLRQAEEELLEAATRTTHAETTLKEQEASLILSPLYAAATNDKTRGALVVSRLQAEREALADAKAEEARAAAMLRVLQAEAAILRACAKLIGGGDEDA